tara:strand:+ start:7641 stop:8285 length:645 start_codon:yes stop_codon:yes gene_type:complete
MATVLYYGNGECEIDSGGAEVRGVEISYRGNVKEIKQTAGDSFYLQSNDKKIIIFPFGDGFLNKLFVYSGSMKIVDFLVVDNNGEKIPCRIKRVMDYTELIYSNSEDITTLSENLNVDSRGFGKTVDKGTNRTKIENLNTKEGYYLIDGTPYAGDYHVHFKDSALMTGATHTPESQDLYYKKVEGGRVINNLIPTRKPKLGKADKRKKRRKRRN